MINHPYFPVFIRDVFIEIHQNRPYHNLDHLDKMWNDYNNYFDGEYEEVIKYAIAYHDCVYHPLIGDNEQRSNNVWLNHARNFSIPNNITTMVSECILATANHPVSSTSPEYVRIFCDLDLLILASDADEYNQYVSNIRKEYDHLNDQQFCDGRKLFLSGLLNSNSIFSHDTTYKLFENRARKNLNIEFGKIK